MHLCPGPRYTVISYSKYYPQILLSVMFCCQGNIQNWPINDEKLRKWNDFSINLTRSKWRTRTVLKGHHGRCLELKNLESRSLLYANSKITPSKVDQRVTRLFPVQDILQSRKYWRFRIRVVEPQSFESKGWGFTTRFVNFDRPRPPLQWAEEDKNRIETFHAFLKQLHGASPQLDTQ